MRGLVIVDPPRSGESNMAIDDALLQNANSDWPIVLRVYQWERPTLSIGHFQRIEDREQAPNLRDLQWVRRKTGGGAIVHDQELTYSILIPKRDNQSSKGHNESLYRAIHGAFADSLRTLGWNAQLSETCTNKMTTGKNQEPFLCFLRRTPLDLVVGDDKILGSAQRRSPAGLIQHGSFLLRRSQSALELFGLLDASKGSTPVHQVEKLSLLHEKEVRGYENDDASNFGSVSSVQSSNGEIDGWIDFFVASLKQGLSQLFQIHWYNGNLGDLVGGVRDNGVTHVYG